jgi:diguanylate cyclase (GGDEF)-like protein
MTAEIIQKYEVERFGAQHAQIFSSIVNRHPLVSGAKLRLPQFSIHDNAGAAHDFDKTENEMPLQDFSYDGFSRLMANTLALLDHAHKVIDEAEQKIKLQEKRIEELQSLSVTDELTSLRNRRGFYEAFLAELDRCDRSQSQGGLLVLVDLDNFKIINDTYGHAAGDACLKLVARTLKDQVRVMDTSARLGGDEFVLLLSNTSKEDATKRAHALAWQLNNLSLAWYGEEIAVRASLGLKSFGCGDCADKIFNDADMQLYASKSLRSRRKDVMEAQAHIQAAFEGGSEISSFERI